jgi:hypothetical protein
MLQLLLLLLLLPGAAAACGFMQLLLCRQRGCGSCAGYGLHWLDLQQRDVTRKSQG